MHRSRSPLVLAAAVARLTLCAVAAVSAAPQRARAEPDAPKTEQPAGEGDPTPGSTPDTTPDSTPAPAPAPRGFVQMYVAAVIPTEGGPAVVLRDLGKEKLLPIWVGASEGHAIQLRLERRRFARPLTHDLLDAIVHDLGGQIVRITVEDMKGETFVGTVFVRHGGEVQRYDARASDSIALAVGNGAPIFVSEVILQKMGSRRPDLESSPLEGDDEDEPEHPAPPGDKPPTGIQTL